jgi:glutathione S-transferase
VPVLTDGDVTVWDSLAIIEYLAETFPQVQLWPQDLAARAHARAVSAEMHGGFGGLRRECGMNIHRPVGPKALSEEAKENIARVQDIWTDCRRRYGGAGPFLFGTFSAADAMYAPVVHRFRTYAIAVSLPVKEYMKTMLAYPAFAEWTAQALAETLVIERFETD